MNVWFLGSQFDYTGNLANWWEGDSQKKFEERAQCIINQYSNYTEPLTGLKLNGINTQGENIADNGEYKLIFISILIRLLNNKLTLKVE